MRVAGDGAQPEARAGRLIRTARSRWSHWLRHDDVRHHRRVVQIDLAALPDDPAVLQRMLQEVVPELQAENEKLWLLIQRLLRHRYGPCSRV